MEDTLSGVTGANVQNPVAVENKQKAGHVLIHHQRTEERIAADWEKAGTSRECNNQGCPGTIVFFLWY